MPPRRFAPGFRLSALDAAVLLAGIAAAALARQEIAIPSAVAVGHFFLFCNVFRIPRRPELVWAASYLVLVTCTVAFGRPGWMPSTLLALALAAFLIFRETRKPGYHGVGWRTLNPDLPRWWAEHSSGRLSLETAVGPSCLAQPVGRLPPASSAPCTRWVHVGITRATSDPTSCAILRRPAAVSSDHPWAAPDKAGK